MKVLAVIPAHYASTRFPGKPLALLAGKPIIQWVWEHVACCGDGDNTGASVITEAMVATDDQRIVEAVRQFGGKAMMTSSQHRSGTDRCGEVLRNLEAQGCYYDVVVNVQGDEPFVQQSQLASLVGCFADASTQIATLKTAISSQQELLSPNNVKVVCGKEDRAIYFSRQPIPYRRGEEFESWLQVGDYFKHVGIYAFRSQVLAEVCKLPQSPLECSEKLEQLRWLEAGYTIAVRETPCANIGIDTPEDLAAAEREMRNEN
jgi:3-deoxy-manno-octulosonate cytidylyltransferase (CMP-KDO synthetase)